jgi:hypothetical protein
MARNDILAKLAIQIVGDNAKLGVALNQSSNQLKQFTNTVTSVGSALGAAFGGAAIFAGLKQAQGIASRFEATMSEVKAITGAAGNEFKSLQNDALRLGNSTKFTATEVGNLQVAYGRLGFTTKEILAATAATLDLAAATGEDLAKSADVAGSTVRGFGLGAEETQRIVDVMAASFNKTALGLDNFTESMKYVAPVAAAAGATVEETTALLGTLADAGIRGSMAGTSLRKIFTDMTKDGRPLKERLAELAARGITLADSFDEVGRTAQTSLLILSKNTEKTDALAESFLHVTGEAKKMALVMGDNLLGDVDKLSSAFEGLFTRLSQSGALRDLTKALTGIVNALAGSSVPIDDQIDFFAKTFARLGDSYDPAHRTIVTMIEEIKQARAELGKPIETPQLDFLIDKYQLTEKQARILKETFDEINKSFSLQEQVLKNIDFINVKNGYKDATQGAKEYLEQLNALQIAEINKQQISKQNNIDVNDNSFTADIEQSQTLIDRYSRIIAIIKEYIETLNRKSDEAEKGNKAEIETIASLEAKIKDLKLQLEGRPTGDILGMKAISSQIDAIALKIENIKNKIAGIRDEIFGATGILSNQAVNVSGKQVLGDSTTDKQILGFLQNKGIGETAFSIPPLKTDEFIDSLKKVEDRTVLFVSKMGQEMLDLGGLVSNAITGIATSIGEQLAAAFDPEVVPTKDFGKAMLGVLGDFAKQFGSLLIAAGVGTIALESGNPGLMIAGGAALVAIGAALSALSDKRSNISSRFSSGGESSSGLSQNGRFETSPAERINFTFRIEGNDLVAAIDKTNKENGRLIGTGS